MYLDHVGHVSVVSGGVEDGVPAEVHKINIGRRVLRQREKNAVT